jgi:hypothetical protein
MLLQRDRIVLRLLVGEGLQKVCFNVLFQGKSKDEVPLQRDRMVLRLLAPPMGEGLMCNELQRSGDGELRPWRVYCWEGSE